MGNNGEEQQDIIESIKILLRTTEELKAYIPSLIKDQDSVFGILQLHDEAISKIMNIFTGTQEEQRKRLNKLELTISLLPKIEKRLEHQESLHKEVIESLHAQGHERASHIIKKSIEGTILKEDLTSLDEIISRYPDNKTLLDIKVDVLITLIRKEESDELLREALKFTEEAIQKFPDDAWLWYHRGLFQRIHKEDPQEVIKNFDKALELIKDDDTDEVAIKKHLVYFARASFLASIGKIEEALDSAINAVEMNRECPPGWYLKGKILFDLDRFSEALGCFERAIQLDNNFTIAWFMKGVTLSALGPKFLDEAILSFNRVIELDKEDAPAYFLKGKLLSEKKRYQDSLHAVNEGLRYDNEDPCGWCLRGIILSDLGREEEAIQSYEKGMSLDLPEKCYLIFNNYGYSLYLLERYEEGEEYARKALELSPNDVVILDTLACNLQGLGKDDEALKVFEQALLLKEDDREITWDALAKLYDRLGMTEKAKEAYEKMEKIKEEAENI